MYLVIFITFIFFLSIYKKKVPYLPYDNTSKIQSLNRDKIQLSLFLLPLPIFLYQSELYFCLVLLGSLIVGILDDKFHLNVKIRFIAISSFLLIYSFFSNHLIFFELIDNTYILIIITITLLLGFIHTMNMLDGRNGIVILFFFNVFFYIFFKKIFLSDFIFIDFFYLIIFLIMFLMNLSNISFLGNSGLIFISLYTGYYLIDCYNINLISEKEIFCLFYIPFFDGIRVTYNRLLKKVNIFKPDKNHLHHKIKNWNLGLFILSLSMIINDYLAYSVHYNFIIIFFISILVYFLILNVFEKN